MHCMDSRAGLHPRLRLLSSCSKETGQDCCLGVSDRFPGSQGLDVRCRQLARWSWMDLRDFRDWVSAACGTVKPVVEMAILPH